LLLVIGNLFYSHYFLNFSIILDKKAFEQNAFIVHVCFHPLVANGLALGEEADF
jgi:hypothetical protein